MSADQISLNFVAVARIIATVEQAWRERDEAKASIAYYNQLYKSLEAERDALRTEVKQLRVQLAGCSTAALGATDDVFIAEKGDYEGEMTVLVISGLVIGTIGFLVATLILNGYVLSVLWGWFIVPAFNAPPLGLVSAIGIVLVVSFMTHQGQYKRPDEQPTLTKIGEVFLTGMLKPVVALCVGWILLFFL